MGGSSGTGDNARYHTILLNETTKDYELHTPELSVFNVRETLEKLLSLETPDELIFNSYKLQIFHNAFSALPETHELRKEFDGDRLKEVYDRVFR
jgi:hypothetical protein